MDFLKETKKGYVDKLNIERRLAITMKAKAFSRLETNLGTRSQVRDVSDISVPIIKKNKETESLIMSALNKNLLFNNYSRHQVFQVMRAMKPKITESGEMLIREGDVGFNFYVIAEGKFNFTKKDNSIPDQIYEKEFCFGELSLLFDSPRYLSVMSMERGKVFRLERPVFQAILATNTEEKIKAAISVLQTVEILKTLKYEQIIELAKAGHYQVFKPDDMIIKKGDTSNFFYFVLIGRVKVIDPGAEDADLIPTVFSAGHYFGEHALHDNKPRSASIRALDETHLLVLDRGPIVSILGKTGTMQAVNTKYEDRLLNSVFLVHVLSEPGFHQLRITLGATKSFVKQQIVYQGNRCESIFIVKEGDIKVTLGKDDVRYLGVGSYLGHWQILNNINHEKLTLQVISDKAEIFVLGKKQFRRIFSVRKNYREEVLQSIDDHNSKGGLEILYLLLHKDFKDRTKAIRRTMVPASALAFRESNRLTGISTDETLPETKFVRSTSPPRVDFYSLTSVSVLGNGAFGVVRLVRDKNFVYALKCVSIQTLIAKSLQHTAGNEKDMLRLCCHPFIVRLYQTFKDFTYFYLLLEPILGGDLFTYLYETRTCYQCELQNSFEDGCEHDPTLPEKEALFYIACVVDAFDYLHTKKIVYRDLKLENVMIDSEGYLKLVDFGFAKKLTSFRSYTPCGTFDYLAPEVVLNLGHNRSVDLWALGVFSFELLVGVPPFSKTRDKRLRNDNTTFRNITKVKYSKNLIKNEKAKDFIDRILQKGPLARLGMKNEGTLEMKQHKWFVEELDFSFDTLRDKEAIPFWIPKLESDVDTKYFDEELCETYSRNISNSTAPGSRVKSLNAKLWYQEF